MDKVLLLEDLELNETEVYYSHRGVFFKGFIKEMTVCDEDSYYLLVRDLKENSPQQYVEFKAEDVEDIIEPHSGIKNSEYEYRLVLK